LALISPEDKHHAEVIKLLDELRGEVVMSPFSLIELDLLLRSGEIVVKEVEAFYDTLGDLLDFREVEILPTKPRYHGEAFGLRKKHESLKYFDSLHASVALVENLELVSYDKEYKKVMGLNHSHPREHIR